MSRFRREEDAADLWLREHDPYYTDPKKNKRKFISHPYDTPEQEKRKAEMELPLSCLSMKQMLEIGGNVAEEAYTGQITFEL